MKTRRGSHVSALHLVAETGRPSEQASRIDELRIQWDTFSPEISVTSFSMCSCIWAHRYTQVGMHTWISHTPGHTYTRTHTCTCQFPRERILVTGVLLSLLLYKVQLNFLKFAFTFGGDRWWLTFFELLAFSHVSSNGNLATNWWRSLPCFEILSIRPIVEFTGRRQPLFAESRG